MPEDSFGPFGGFNPAPWKMPASPARRAGANIAPGHRRRSRPRTAARPTQRPGHNITAGQTKEMPMETGPVTASGIPSGMTQGMASEPAPGNLPAVARKNTDESKIAESVLDFSPGGLLNGIILSEILGKPRCLQKTFRKRW
jgi:hypothetical protein